MSGELAASARQTLNSSTTREQFESALTELALAAGGGDDSALDGVLGAVLVRRVGEGAARSLLLNASDIDDAIQASLITVSTKIAQFEGRSSFSSWFSSIVRNEALALLRRRHRSTEVPLEHAGDHDRLLQRMSSVLASSQAQDQAMKTLSTDHQQVLKLRDGEGYSYEAIAEQLEIPLNTVRTRVHRGRRQLVSELARAFELPEFM